MKYYRITARSKALCNEIDEDAFIVDFKDLLKKYGISSVQVNIFKHDNL
jgi:hypothetical protein